MLPPGRPQGLLPVDPHHTLSWPRDCAPSVWWHWPRVARVRSPGATQTALCARLQPRHPHLPAAAVGADWLTFPTTLSLLRFLSQIPAPFRSSGSRPVVVACVLFYLPSLRSGGWGCSLLHPQRGQNIRVKGVDEVCQYWSVSVSNNSTFTWYSVTGCRSLVGIQCDKGLPRPVQGRS